MIVLNRYGSLALVALLAACGGSGTPDTAADGRAVPLSSNAADATTASDASTLAAAPASPSGSEPSSAALARAAVERRSKLYIVEMVQAPVVAYAGGVAGLKATKPAKGSKIDPLDPAVVQYGDFLVGQHDAKLRSVGGRKAYSYRYAFNGFAAELTATQVAKLQSDKQVAAVTADEINKLSTVSTPAFLGLNAPGGLWSQLSGNADGSPISSRGPNSAGAGEGIVVGIIDSGIWPENPSFSDRDADGKLVFQQLPGWHGKCVPGEAFNASDCNQKLITARYYTEGFGGSAALKSAFPYEFISARAADGHGVHTAGTAAGNFGVAASADGIALGRISGMAPRARVAVYKVCWGVGEGGCPTSDSVAAIDQAVADGVDVLNFSISGTSTNFRDPVEIAFLFAADAGVFVAASAGNSGPGAATVAHPSPWLTSVAASTHDRVYQGTVTLGNGSVYTGASLTGPVGPAPLVNASAVGLAGKAAPDVALCFLNALDPAKVAGKIVVCERGVNARTEKSAEVKRAGGVGMILVNTNVNSLNADLHPVPTVHLAVPARAPVQAYAATAGATARLSQGVLAPTGTVNAPLMAAFSSRGPLRAGDGNLLKPDITAPGVDVLAAYSPAEAGRNFDFLSGTSMSSPHIAGLAALMKQRHPTWAPMAIKSALMTTAYQTVKSGPNAGAAFGGPFDFGAGHVDINKAVNPGLVFDAGFNDWLGFLCGTQLPASFCTGTGVPVLQPSDLNVPSIAIGALAGTQSVKRTVRNVSGQTATFTAAVSGVSGVGVVVSPASFTLSPGASTTVTVSFTTTTAVLNAYATGAITWTSDKGHGVRIPVVARPVALAAPVAVSGTGAPISYPVSFGYTGSFSATARGLALAAVTPGTVQQDPDQTFDVGDPTGTVAIPVTIPAGTTYARIALFDADVAAGSDMDLYVYQGATPIGISAGGTSAEEVNLSYGTPTAAAVNLTVYVHGWGLPAGSSPFKLNVWTLGTAAAGNLDVTAPSTATLGTMGTITLTPSPALAAGRYLGSVVYGGSPGLPAPTIVRIDK
ncbi:MAG: S8 family peptidase [Microbacteriaceae bacterium]|nr:S8 family peptidase [Burkholderiaceae bacterium]